MKTMRKIFPVLFVMLLTVVLVSCGGQKNISISSLQTDGAFTAEGLAFGTDYETVYEKYQSPEVDPESDKFEDWRNSVLTADDQRTFRPVETRSIEGKEGTLAFSFQDDRLNMAGYTVSLKSDETDDWIGKLVKSCCDAFGKGSMSTEEFTGLCKEVGNGVLVGIYWTGTDGSVLQLTVSKTTFGATVGLTAIAPDTGSPISGKKDALSVPKK